jgi:hypothetical protein
LAYGLLFTLAAEILQTFFQNWWDGKLGIIMVLHTRGQILNDHPHVHCIIAGGALTNDCSAFVRAPKSFLCHVRPCPRSSGAFIAALQRLQDQGKLTLSRKPALATAAGWESFSKALRGHDWPYTADMDTFLTKQGFVKAAGQRSGTV